MQGPQVLIQYTIAEPALVSVRIFNLLGQQMAVLEQGVRAAGAHKLNWSKPGAMANGIYFVQAKLGKACFTGRLVLVQ